MSLVVEPGVPFYRYERYLDKRMERKLVDMSGLEYSVVSTIVVAAIVHYTRLARVARGRNLSVVQRWDFTFSPLYSDRISTEGTAF